MDIPSELARIVISETSDQQMVLLKEKDGSRKVPIIISIFEAIAIDRAINDRPVIRPMTHDLTASLLEALEAKVEEILGVVQDPQALEDFGSDEDSPGLLRFVADPNAPSPLEKTVDRELREKVEATLEALGGLCDSLGGLAGRKALVYAADLTGAGLGALVASQLVPVLRVEGCLVAAVLPLAGDGHVYRRFFEVVARHGGARRAPGLRRADALRADA